MYRVSVRFGVSRCCVAVFDFVMFEKIPEFMRLLLDIKTEGALAFKCLKVSRSVKPGHRTGVVETVPSEVAGSVQEEVVPTSSSSAAPTGMFAPAEPASGRVRVVLSCTRDLSSPARLGRTQGCSGPAEGSWPGFR